MMNLLVLVVTADGMGLLCFKLRLVWVLLLLLMVVMMQGGVMTCRINLLT